MYTIDIAEAAEACIAKGYTSADRLPFDGSLGSILLKDGRWMAHHKATEARIQALAATGDRAAAEAAARPYYSPSPRHGSCAYCGQPLTRHGHCEECV